MAVFKTPDNIACDVKLKVENQYIECHKAVLSDNSPFFSTMFTSNFLESTATEVELNCSSFDSLKQVIHFMYNKVLNITEGNVFEIMDLAHMFFVPGLKSHVCDYLINVLDVSQIVAKYILKHFDSLLKDEASFTTYRDVLSRIINTPLFRSSLFNGLNKHRTELKDLNYLKNFAWNVRLSETVVVIGGIAFQSSTSWAAMESFIEGIRSSRHLSATVIYENERLERDEFLPAMNNSRCMFAAAKEEDVFENVQKVFVVGGLHSEKNSGTNCTLIRKLPSKLYSARAAFLGDDLYVTGGFPGDAGVRCRTATGDVLVYISKLNKWLHRSPLTHKRAAHGMCNIFDVLYVFGGLEYKDYYDDQVSVRSVECYDEKLDKWCVISEMPKSIYSFACVGFNKFVYIIGGKDYPYESRNVYKYDALTREWTTCQPMEYAVSECSATIKNNRIFCAGGYRTALNAVKDSLTTVLLYNPKTDAWSYAPLTLDLPRACCYAATINTFVVERVPYGSALKPVSYFQK